MSILVGVSSAEFSFLPENIETTKGNLSFQISKLDESGYIEIIKSFRNKYPLTTLKITEKGIDAYEKYINDFTGYFEKSGKKI